LFVDTKLTPISQFHENLSIPGDFPLAFSSCLMFDYVRRYKFISSSSSYYYLTIIW